MRCFIILLNLLLISNCSSLQGKLPPDDAYILKLEKSIDNNLPANRRPGSENMKKDSWAYDYILAKKYFDEKKYDKACVLFEKLRTIDEFTLKDVSFVRALRSCSYSNEKLILLWDSVKVPSWLDEEYDKLSLEIANNNKLVKYIIYFSVEVSKHERLQHKKVKLMQTAISLSEDFEQEEKFKKRMYMIAPHLNPDITNANMFLIARDLERNRFFDKSRVLYRKIINKEQFSFEEKISAWERVKLSYKIERKLKEFRIKTKEMSDFIFNLLENSPNNVEYQKAWYKNQINLARAVWTENKAVEAQKILLFLLNDPTEDENQKALAYRILAGIKMEAKKNDQALDYFLKAKEFNITNREIKEQVYWGVGWIYFLKKDYSNSALVFEEYIDDTSNKDLKRKLIYWQAQSLDNLNEKSKADRLWSELSEEDSFGYYGVLAARAIGKSFEPVLVNSKLKTPTLPIFEWLVSMKEYEIGKNYLLNYTRNLSDEDDIINTLPMFSKVKSYDQPIYQYYKLSEDTRDEMIGTLLDIVYPRPFEGYITEASERFKVDKSYVFSIMRQESTFNPTAKSWAHAYGLMQLIPERAKQLSEKYQIPYVDYKDLWDEKTNTYMGCAFLMEMKENFERKFILTTASYNASSKAVRQWEKDRFDGDHLKFVELIPYKETRNYIKLVMRNYINYKRLLAKDPFPFPEDIFINF